MTVTEAIQIAEGAGVSFENGAPSGDLRTLDRDLLKWLVAHRHEVEAYARERATQAYIHHLWSRVFQRFQAVYGPKSWWPLERTQNLDAPPPYLLLQFLTTDPPPATPPRPRPILEFRVETQSRREACR